MNKKLLFVMMVLLLVAVPVSAGLLEDIGCWLGLSKCGINLSVPGDKQEVNITIDDGQEIYEQKYIGYRYEVYDIMVNECVDVYNGSNKTTGTFCQDITHKKRNITKTYPVYKEKLLRIEYDNGSIKDFTKEDSKGGGK